MKPPSRHLSTAQRAGAGVVLLVLVTLGCAAYGVEFDEGVIEVVVAGVSALGLMGTGTASVSAGRDVARAWRGQDDEPKP